MNKLNWPTNDWIERKKSLCKKQLKRKKRLYKKQLNQVLYLTGKKT